VGGGGGRLRRRALGRPAAPGPDRRRARLTPPASALTAARVGIGLRAATYGLWGSSTGSRTTRCSRPRSTPGPTESDRPRPRRARAAPARTVPRRRFPRRSTATAQCGGVRTVRWGARAPGAVLGPGCRQQLRQVRWCGPASSGWRAARRSAAKAAAGQSAAAVDVEG
jgi:hypothetical protein